MAVAADPVTFPYRPSGGFTNEQIWSGAQAPVPDSVPDGTPKEVKDRLWQTVVSGAETLLRFLQYKALPRDMTSSQERPGVPVPTIQNRTGSQGDANTPTIKITGEGRGLTNTAVWALVAVGVAAFFFLTDKKAT